MGLYRMERQGPWPPVLGVASLGGYCGLFCNAEFYPHGNWGIHVARFARGVLSQIEPCRLVFGVECWATELGPLGGSVGAYHRAAITSHPPDGGELPTRWTRAKILIDLCKLGRFWANRKSQAAVTSKGNSLVIMSERKKANLRGAHCFSPVPRPSKNGQLCGCIRKHTDDSKGPEYRTTLAARHGMKLRLELPDPRVHGLSAGRNASQTGPILTCVKGAKLSTVVWNDDGGSAPCVKVAASGPARNCFCLHTATCLYLRECHEGSLSRR